MGSACGKQSASADSANGAMFEEASESFVHHKARTSPYPSSNPSVDRLPVADNLVPWSAAWENYDPPYYTDPWVLGKDSSRRPSWADPEIDPNTKNPPAFNSIDDGMIDRRTRCFGNKNARYEVVDGYPRNPMGRTGLRGRGRLGRWGPNHAADPIVTRWKRKPRNESYSSLAGDQQDEDDDCVLLRHPETNKPILQFVAVLRDDTEEWAIPGGMICGDEIVSTTLKRRFTEEALDALNLSDQEVTQCKTRIARFFAHGTKIYTGYVDDPRNTDNAWMETAAYNFHDESGEAVGRLNFRAGLDTGAQQVQWMDCSGGSRYFASHAEFLKKVAEIHGAHW